MVAPSSTNSKSKNGGGAGKAKKMGLRHMICSVLDPEMQVVGSPKGAKQQEEEEKRLKEEREAQAKSDAEFLARARAAVLEQAEKLPTRSLSTQPSDRVRSLEPPAISSIVDSVSNHHHKKDHHKKEANHHKKKDHKKKANHRKDKKKDNMSLEAPVLSSIVASASKSKSADDADAAAGGINKSKSSAASSQKSKDSGSGSRGKTRSSPTRIVVREDTAPPPKDEAEQTIIKLLLSDVWSGNQAVVECSLKLINICLERDPKAAKAMLPVGGHTVMLGIMKKWGGNAKIQAHACHFIGKCCSCSGNKFFADAVLKYGALPRIQKALVKFPKYLMVQTAGCQALEQMMLTCADHRAVMDGIDIAVVVSAMKTLTVTGPLQKSCAGILQGLAEDPAKAQTIVAEGGMEVLGGAYHRFCDATDAEHRAIRQRCRAAFPKLLKDYGPKVSLANACTTMTPSNVAGCSLLMMEYNN